MTGTTTHDGKRGAIRRLHRTGALLAATTCALLTAQTAQAAQDPGPPAPSPEVNLAPAVKHYGLPFNALMQVDLPSTLPPNFRFSVGQNVQFHCNDRDYPALISATFKMASNARNTYVKQVVVAIKAPTLTKPIFGGRGWLKGYRVVRLPGVQPIRTNGEPAHHNFNPFLRDQGRKLNFEFERVFTTIETDCFTELYVKINH
jgi:hypothetical protein